MPYELLKKPLTNSIVAAPDGAVLNMISCASFAAQAYMAAHGVTETDLTHLIQTSAMKFTQ